MSKKNKILCIFLVIVFVVIIIGIVGYNFLGNWHYDNCVYYADRSGLITAKAKDITREQFKKNKPGLCKITENIYPNKVENPQW